MLYAIKSSMPFVLPAAVIAALTLVSRCRAEQLHSITEKSCQIVVYGLTTTIYNLFWHKLASFPGPILARSSLVRLPLDPQATIPV